MTSKYDVVGIGNSLVDVLARVEENFISQNNLTKGSMQLINDQQAVALYNKMPPAQETSGGSAGNSMAAFSSLGGKCAFITRLGQDELGNVFAHDMRAQKVDFIERERDTSLSTGRCLIMVTPDGERTMNTSLGSNLNFSVADLCEQTISQTRIVYLEGYLFDQPSAIAAYYKACDLARQYGAKVALTLSDSFCVERHRAEFLTLVKEKTDILFANESEIKALYGTTHVDEALAAVSSHCGLAIVTCGAKGALVRSGQETHAIKAAAVNTVVDLTGAGDAFAAGFLYGYCQNLSIAEAGRIAALSSAEVISHFGARPEIPLNTLLAA